MAVSARGLRAGRAVIEIGLVGIGVVEKGLNGLERSARRVGQSISRIGGGAGGGGLTDGFSGLRNLFVGSMATEALLYPIKLASNIELASAQMAVFTGGAGVARDMMIELQKFSAVSFIPSENLSAGAAMMIRYGIAQSRVVADTKALAVVAGGSVEEFDKLTLAYAQVASAGRLQGEEMRQFKNTAFNPLREIAAQTGETMLVVRKRMEAGQISFEEVANALQHATGAGGRFNGMLEKISGTLRGQINKAIAQLKLAVLPIGDDALKPLTEFFQKINMIIPRLAEFIKKNVAWFRGIMEGSAVIAAAGTAFVALGLIGAVVSIAFGGFAAIVSAIATSLIALAPIVGLLILAMKGLGISFADVKNEAGLWIGVILDSIGSFYRKVREVFGAIFNAMAGGDFKLATDILWAALNAAWQTGLASLMGLWIRFKFGLASAWVGLVATLKTAWVDFMEWFRKEIVSIGSSIELMILRATGRDTLANLTNVFTAEAGAKLNIERNAAGQRGAITQDVNAAQSLIGLAEAFALGTTGAGALAAQGNLAGLMAKAAALVAGKGAALGDFGLGFQVALGNLAGTAADKVLKPQALFDTRLAAQTFGGQDSIQREQLAELRDINKNTGRGFGIGFI